MAAGLTAPVSNPIWSLGHSTRSLEELIRILRTFEIKTLVDIRTIPRSRANPQFNQDTFSSALEEQTIDYKHIKGLGGLRRARKDSINLGWNNLSFRGFADHMQTPEFSSALDELIQMSKNHNSAMMCAEALPWRCHRRLIGDALVVRGHKVREIISPLRFQDHVLTKWARVNEGMITYPPSAGILSVVDPSVVIESE
jgi:uncharacterized protein (DUF488 family)